ncbi:MAG: hypothetical protein M1814_003972 [Vezdaea aestivalis]|nr:MAG: hypothetical protein M1814_003972 [Vezdaea aestivalis]
MASVITDSMGWHQGEELMQNLLHAPKRENPAAPGLTAGAAWMMEDSSLLVVGTLDDDDQPWTSIWGGTEGTAQKIQANIVAIGTNIDRDNDPVVRALLGNHSAGSIVRSEGRGKMISALGLNLEQRRRIKLFGRMVAGAYKKPEAADTSPSSDVDEAQVIIKIEESMNNCPKYINTRHVRPVQPEPHLVSETLPLHPDAIKLVEKSDMLFISSSNHDEDMDSNHRGGPPGFVRVLANEDAGTVLVYPEYSGNRLYQTLGNLQMTPKAGITFPDYDTGDVLYLTGETTILSGQDAARVLTHSNLAVRFEVKKAIFVRQGLSFRGDFLAYSPYNPKVRFLQDEKAATATVTSLDRLSATLINKKEVTPTIMRYTFRLSTAKSSQWKAGQYAVLEFEDELGMGYSHMRDDDPQSLNDDLVRTFTISSQTHSQDFEMTIRNVGRVTKFLAMQNPRAALEIPVQSFGGEFFIEQNTEEDVVFVAGGIGITPLLSQIPHLDLSHFRLLWGVNVKDKGLVLDVFEQYPGLAERTTIYLSGNSEATSALETKTIGHLERRRMVAEDLAGVRAKRWYICASPKFTKEVSDRLEGQEVHTEGFNF